MGGCLRDPSPVARVVPRPPGSCPPVVGRGRYTTRVRPDLGLSSTGPGPPQEWGEGAHAGLHPAPPHPTPHHRGSHPRGFSAEGPPVGQRVGRTGVSTVRNLYCPGSTRPVPVGTRGRGWNRQSCHEGSLWELPPNRFRVSRDPVRPVLLLRLPDDGLERTPV